MTSLGFPDWQRITQWIGRPLLELDDEPVGIVLEQLLSVRVSSWRSLSIVFASSAGNVYLKPAFSTAGASSVLVPSPDLYSPGGVVGRISLPVIGDTFTLSAALALAGQTMDMVVVPTNLEVDELRRVLSFDVLSTIGTNVGAGASTVLDLTGYHGPARMHLSLGGPTWDVLLRGYTHLGAVLTQVFYRTGINGQREEEIILPPCVNQLTLTNTSGAVQSATAAIIAA